MARNMRPAPAAGVGNERSADMSGAFSDNRGTKPPGGGEKVKSTFNGTDTVVGKHTLGEAVSELKSQLSDSSSASRGSGQPNG